MAGLENGGRGEQAVSEGVGLLAGFEGGGGNIAGDLHGQGDVLDEGQGVGDKEQDGQRVAIDGAEIEGEEALEDFHGCEHVELAGGEIRGVDGGEGGTRLRGIGADQEARGGLGGWGWTAYADRGGLGVRGRGHDRLGGEQGQRAGDDGEGFGSQPEGACAGMPDWFQRRLPLVLADEHRFTEGESQAAEDSRTCWRAGSRVVGGLEGGNGFWVGIRDSAGGDPYNAGLVISGLCGERNCCVQAADFDG